MLLEEDKKEVLYSLRYSFLLKNRSYLLFFTYSQLLIHGIHVGHSYRNTHFYALWLVFMRRQGLFILNIFKTVVTLRSGIKAVSAAAAFFQPVWFVNLDQASGVIVRRFAKYCGEFSCTTAWIYGFISNYLGIFNTYYKLRRLAYSAWNGHNQNSSRLFKSWFYTRNTWPRVVFVSSVHNSYQPTKEAFNLGVPCIGIVDNDTYTHVASLPMPGNDESSDCMIFYNEFFSKYSALRKFFNLSGWYYNIKLDREPQFVKWFEHRKKQLIRKNSYKQGYLNVVDFLVSCNVKLVKRVNVGMRMFFAQYYIYQKAGHQEKLVYFGRDNRLSRWEKKPFRSIRRHVRVEEEKILLKHRQKLIRYHEIVDRYNVQPDYFTMLERNSMWFKINAGPIFKQGWFQSWFIAKRFRNQRYFQYRILRKRYLKRYLSRNRIYKTHMRYGKFKPKVARRYLKFYLLSNYMRFFNISTHSNNNHHFNYFTPMAFAVTKKITNIALPLIVPFPKHKWESTMTNDLKVIKANFYYSSYNHLYKLHNFWDNKDHNIINLKEHSHKLSRDYVKNIVLSPKLINYKPEWVIWRQHPAFLRQQIKVYKYYRNKYVRRYYLRRYNKIKKYENKIIIIKNKNKTKKRIKPSLNLIILNYMELFRCFIDEYFIDLETLVKFNLFYILMNFLIKKGMYFTYMIQFNKDEKLRFFLGFLINLCKLYYKKYQLSSLLVEKIKDRNLERLKMKFKHIQKFPSVRLPFHESRLYSKDTKNYDAFTNFNLLEHDWRVHFTGKAHLKLWMKQKLARRIYRYWERKRFRFWKKKKKK